MLLVFALTLLFGLPACVQPPSIEAQFTFSPAAGTSPLAVQFDASSSWTGTGVLTSYAWDLGDGSTGLGRLLAHTYVVEEETTFDVSLVVTDSAGRHATAAGTVTVHPAPPAAAGPPVVFAWPFHYNAEGNDEGNLNDEYLTLHNQGATSVDLSGWTIENDRGETYRFPHGFELPANGIVTVRSGKGTDTPSDLYWNSSSEVWLNTVDLAILKDAQGHIADLYAYASC